MAEKENITEEENKEKVEQNSQNNEQTNLQKEYDELDDRYKRVYAEFENYKKRTQKEKENLYNSIFGDIIINILPIIDNLEMAVNSECKDENYKKGVELVQKQIKEFLSKNNIEEIKSVGETFDPALHEAISTVQDDSKGVQEIVQEYRKGYKIGSKILRHSLVVVAN